MVLPAALLLAGAGASAAEAVADVIDGDGKPIGTVEFIETPSGTMHLVWQLEGIPPGVHGVHVHETGLCDAPDFMSAGGHLAGGKPHGIMAEGGPHPGDLPNAHVGDDGKLAVEYFTDALDFGHGDGGSLFDTDGSSVIVHSGPDDYTSQPSGEAGTRIACGVIAIRN